MFYEGLKRGLEGICCGKVCTNVQKEDGFTGANCWSHAFNCSNRRSAFQKYERKTFRRVLANLRFVGLRNLPGATWSRKYWHGFTATSRTRLGLLVDHSGAAEATVEIRRTAVATEMIINDNGVGIFEKIQRALKLQDERYALIELSKGKFTTDPSKHSGEGIFFTSKMFDKFDILSSGLAFSKATSQPQWIKDKFHSGTTVWMKLANDSTREPKGIDDQYTEDFVFDKAQFRSSWRRSQAGPVP